MFELVKPDVKWKETYLRGLAELRAEGWPWHLDKNVDDFAAFVERESTKYHAPEVPETELWAIVDGEFAGRVAVRHRLNEALKVIGGHIGYDTVPSFRGRGVATRMLAAALPIARELGLREVMLTCDETNAGSIRVIEKNGGRLVDTRTLDPARPRKRYYWITL